MWDILSQYQPDKSIVVVLRFKNVVMAIFTIPASIAKPMSILYKDAKKGGKPSMVECDVHKTYGENIPMWAFRTTYPEDKDYIIYRIYNEIHTKFTCYLYDDGHLKVSCPTKMRRIPLDENGKPIHDDPKPEIIEIPRQEEKFADFNEVIENAKSDFKVRRNSA